MHTFKFHLTEAMLLNACKAIQQKRADEKDKPRLTAGGMYALEVSIDLPDGIEAHNLQMDVVEQTFQEQHNRIHLSPIAQSILTVITEGTKPPKSSYIAGWHICDQLGIARIELDCSYTKYDFALKELVDAGLVEELPDLGCRYRLKRQEREG